uniref:DUF3307 domain-containing protein n=1 Tax=Ningiella ruwaisensis TaxID=2364274 RepID=UPI00109EF609|nr:DUF3307 domain-containing protein [Ningiella ruwaisensis]
MSLFILLLLVHLIADFYLQKDAWIQSKIKYKARSIGLLKHILTHLALNSIVLFTMLGFSYLALFALLTIVVSHYAIDIWKTYQGFHLWSFLTDQIAHIVMLGLVCAYVSEPDLSKWQASFGGFLTLDHLIVLAGFLFAYKPLSLIIQLSLRRYTQQLEAKTSNQGLENAGEWIGVFERFLVITFVLLGQFAAVGFLLAAKGVFRFGDMRREQDRKLTEYIMLGTLLSVGLAIGTGLMLNYLTAHN